MSPLTSIFNPNANNILTELKSQVCKIVKNTKQDHYYWVLE